MITFIFGTQSRDFRDADKASRFEKRLDERYKVIVFAEGESNVFKSVKKAKRFIEEELEYSSDSSSSDEYSSDEESSDEEEAPRPKKAPAKKNTKKITELPKAVFGKDPEKARQAALKVLPDLSKNQNVMREQCKLVEARFQAVKNGHKYEPIPRRMNLEKLENEVVISIRQAMPCRRKANGHRGLIKK